MAVKHTINWNLYRRKAGAEVIHKLPELRIEDFPELTSVLENLDFSNTLEENLLLVFKQLNIESIPEEKRKKILTAAKYGMQIKVISLSTIMTNIVLDDEEEGIVTNQEEYKEAFKEMENYIKVDFFDFLILLKEYFKDNYKMN